MKSVQQLRALQRPGVVVARLANIAEMKNGTARLRFADGSVSRKFYRLSPDVAYAPGACVKLEAICGTYVVTGKM